MGKFLCFCYRHVAPSGIACKGTVSGMNAHLTFLFAYFSYRYIRSLPTLFFIKDGKLRYRMEGAMNAEQLDKLVNYVLFDGPPPAESDVTPPDAPVTS